MADDIEVVRKDVFPLPVLIYGRPEGDDTTMVRARLKQLEVPFVEVNVEEDETARRYVENLNHGSMSTPTIIFGDQEFIIVEPTYDELNQALRRAGYEA